MNLNITPTADIQKLVRQFLPVDFTITTWQSLKPYFDELINRPIQHKDDYKKLLHDYSELQAVISEDVCWRQIRMTCDTENKEFEDRFIDYCNNIEPHVKSAAHLIDKKIASSPFFESLEEKEFEVFKRNLQKDIQLFREENITISAEINILSQQYGSITGAMTIEEDGKELTLQQAAALLINEDRSIRKRVYEKVINRRLQDADTLHQLFDKLIQLRHTIANNAGYENYRDYKFAELGRFDYSAKDCVLFHESVKKYILPIVNEIYERRKAELQLDVLKPYDIDAVPAGQQPLKPFQNGKELLEKSIQVFDQVHPFFANCLRTMARMGHVDLESRKGKAPGGYNCPLAETGAPFIFMNAASTSDDVVTMMHEGGHAVHSFLCHPLSLASFKEYPMEVAELASMSMELFTIDACHVFYPDEKDLKRAKRELLERSLTIFPWIAIIDAFQHWLYTHPQHSREEREKAWLSIHNEFSPQAIDWTGLETYRAILWQKQLHLYEAPFYYIEYGIAQLGAYAMWKQYRDNPTASLDNYIQALGHGNTRTLPELYQLAGIRFDFSEIYIQALSTFVRKEWMALIPM
jgi:oligoendopeptidase, M3 family